DGDSGLLRGGAETPEYAFAAPARAVEQDQQRQRGRRCVRRQPEDRVARAAQPEPLSLRGRADVRARTCGEPPIVCFTGTAEAVPCERTLAQAARAAERKRRKDAAGDLSKPASIDPHLGFVLRTSDFRLQTSDFHFFGTSLNIFPPVPSVIT